MNLNPRPLALTPAEEEIRDTLRRHGPITFARFMELALFSPGGGYYTSEHPIGAAGDYFTSPTVHPTFGALLAIQIEQMWRLLDRPSRFYLIEIGAGKGHLSRDILSYAKASHPEFHRSLWIITLDRHSPVFAPNSQEKTATVLSTRIPLHGVTGCILSNELLDSFPVHRIVIQDGRFLEVYVTLKDGQLQEMLAEPSTPLLYERFHSLGIVLPEGYRTEVNLALEEWAREVAQALDRGYVLTIDYGYTAEELYNAARSRGTLRCYFKHTLSANPYQRIGRQDMTAHVDFSTLMGKGEPYSLMPLGLATQREFLLNLGIEAYRHALEGMGLTRHEYEANRLALRELVRPEGLGNFRVLAQGKGAPETPLWGFTSDNPKRREMEALARSGRLSLPLRTSDHMPLYEGLNPEEASFDWETLWKDLQP